MIKLEVSTHNGDIDSVFVEYYDEKDLNDKRNNNKLESILIGRHSYSRIDLKNVKVIEENNG